MWENVKNLRNTQNPVRKCSKSLNTYNPVGKCSKSQKYIESCGEMFRISEIHKILWENAKNLRST
jgi:hypothetical protein